MSKLQAALKGERAITPYEMFRARVEKLRGEIAGLCGRDNVDRFIRVTLNAVQANPAVLEADQRTLLISCLKAAQDNLLPDGREAVLNVYNTKVKGPGNSYEWVKQVQYMPMAYGLVQKIYEAGALLVDAVAVYEQDHFEYRRGDAPQIEHIPYAGEDDPGKVTAAYVIIKLKTGETKREVIFRRDIEKARAASKSPDGFMWTDWYDQGAIKTVIHRVAKQLPRAESLTRALMHDREVTGLRGVDEPIPTEAADVAALVDGRMADELRDSALKARVVDAAAVNRDPAPAGGESQRTAPVEKPTAQEVVNRYATAATIDALQTLADEARAFPWTDEESDQLTAAYTKRLTELDK